MKTSQPANAVDFCRGIQTHYSRTPSLFPVLKIKEEQGIERGRNMERRPRIPHPLDRAESRRRKDEPTMEVDIRSIKTRPDRIITTSDGSIDPCISSMNNLLEPCPHDPICNSVSEMIEESLRNSDFRANRPDTMSSFPPMESSSSHDTSSSGKASIITQTPCFIDCEAQSSRITQKDLADFSQPTTIQTPRPHLMCHLPVEIMHKIYLELHPNDFNSARHSCRSWFINSLEYSLLQTMLKRGGWSAFVLGNAQSSHIPSEQNAANIEWLMSKSISRECALGSDWSGNGLCPKRERLLCGNHKHRSQSSPFIQTSTTDFTEFGVHYPGWEKSSSGMAFTVSTCGRFLMVAHGCLVSIYELNRGHTFYESSQGKKSGSLRPVTSVICPRRVLACSMDTSSRRYAIAVILEGRMGLVCDLTDMRCHSRHPSEVRSLGMSETHLSGRNECRNRVSISSSRIRRLGQARTEQSFVFPIIGAEASQTGLPIETEHVAWYEVDHSSFTLDPATQQPTIAPLSTDHYITSRTSFPMLIEPSTPTLYATLCSADDLPRSVALCPRRRCVAFGCSAGIELHWVDALTGQDLNRWFPLTAPSDYLYFIPPRAGIDSAKKLRLISSAAESGEQSAMAERFGRSVSSSRAGSKGKSSPFWGVAPSLYSGGWTGLDSAYSASSVRPASDNSDHYRAVPLSDGYHILFIDPANGLLSLGSDAPVGGPSKLLRKIQFTGPHGQGNPIAYTASSDLSRGVRVVAGYNQGTEQSIWFFSIPIDCFAEIRSQKLVNSVPFVGNELQTESRNTEWMMWWQDFGRIEPEIASQAGLQSISATDDSIWPLLVRGQEIGTCQGLVDLAIDASPEMTIWAFGTCGVAKAWQIDSGDLEGKIGKKFLVMRDGTVREVDANGDVQMFDVPSSPALSSMSTETQNQYSFDGTLSMANSRVLEDQYSGVYQASINPNHERFDADGDVLMADLPFSEDPDQEHQPRHLLNAVLVALDERDIGDDQEYFANHSDFQQLRAKQGDLIDLLTGITRVDIEIW